jgi:hypothetical protein
VFDRAIDVNVRFVKQCKAAPMAVAVHLTDRIIYTSGTLVSSFLVGGMLVDKVRRAAVPWAGGYFFSLLSGGSAADSASLEFRTLLADLQ